MLKGHVSTLFAYICIQDGMGTPSFPMSPLMQSLDNTWHDKFGRIESSTFCPKMCNGPLWILVPYFPTWTGWCQNTYFFWFESSLYMAFNILHKICKTLKWPSKHKYYKVFFSFVVCKLAKRNNELRLHFGVAKGGFAFIFSSFRICI